MMHFHGFKSKAALKQAVQDASKGLRKPVRFDMHCEETSLFGAEYKPGVATKYCVCMDPAKRTKFANLTVTEDGIISKVA